MNIFITGTPGTGKTTVSRFLKEQLSLDLVDINQLVTDEKLYTGYDEEKGYKIVDLPALCRRIDGIINDVHVEDVLVEGHLSHLCEGADLVIVLRAHPDVLESRLHDKGFNKDKIRENLEAEALDICAFEAFRKYGEKTSEIDTTHEYPQKVVDLIKMVVKGEKQFPLGAIDFSDYFLS